MTPEEALEECLKYYRDQSPYQMRADMMYRAEPSSVSLGSRVPPALARFRTAWPAVRIATHAYADRVRLEDIGFSENPDRVEEIRDQFIVSWSSAILEALATGVGYHRKIVLEDGTLTFAATRGRDGAFIEDPDTGEILATMRVHRPRRYKGPIANPTKVTIYTPGRVSVFSRSGKGKMSTGGWVKDPEEIVVPGDVLMMRPVINRQRAGDEYGRPEGRDLYSFQEQGSRALTDLSIATDALAVPQRVLIAAAPESLSDLSQIQAYMDSILALSGDVKIDQWQAAQLAPFIEAMSGIARNASATSGIPLSYWGIASEANAPSGDAIRENDARLEIRSRAIGKQWTPVAVQSAEECAILLGFDPGVVTAKWADPSTPTPSAATDAAIKLAQVQPVNGEIVVDREMIWDTLRTPPETRDRIREAEQTADLDRLLTDPEASIGEPPPSPSGP